MARIVIVSQLEDSRTKLFRLLTSSGFKVFRSCASGSELRRALSESEDCVVVMIGFTPDCKPDELMWDYKDSIQILLIAKQAVLDNIESPEIFRLALPATGQAVIGAVEMLSQLTFGTGSAPCHAAIRHEPRHEDGGICTADS